MDLTTLRRLQTIPWTATEEREIEPGTKDNERRPWCRGIGVFREPLTKRNFDDDDSLHFRTLPTRTLRSHLVNSSREVCHGLRHIGCGHRETMQKVKRTPAITGLLGKDRRGADAKKGSAATKPGRSL